MVFPMLAPLTTGTPPLTTAAPATVRTGATTGELFAAVA